MRVRYGHRAVEEPGTGRSGRCPARGHLVVNVIGNCTQTGTGLS